MRADGGGLLRECGAAALRRWRLLLRGSGAGGMWCGAVPLLGAMVPMRAKSARGWSKARSSPGCQVVHSSNCPMRRMEPWRSSGSDPSENFS
jgi:hypothetical protein